MAAGGSSSPFGRPPASGGSGSAGRAMFSGMFMPPCGAMKSRSPMVGGIGGMTRSKALASESSDSSASDSEKSFPQPGNISSKSLRMPSRNFSNKKDETEKLSTFDKLISLVKRNGLWPASGLLKYNCSSLNLLFRGQSYSRMSDEVQQELR
jgi:hypothetical protein